MRNSILFKYIYQKVIIAACFVLIFTSLPLTASAQQDNTNIITLNEGWLYRFGDCPLNDNGMPLWIAESNSDSGWTRIGNLNSFSNISTEADTIWFKVKLPNENWNNPSIYFQMICGQSVEVYVDTYKAYEKKRAYVFEWNSLIMHIPQRYMGKTLYIKVDSAEMTKNFGPRPNIYVGNYGALTSLYVKQGFSTIIFGGIFAFLGLILIIGSLFLRKEQIKGWSSLGVVIFCIGLGWLFYRNDMSLFFSNFDEVSLIIYDTIRIILPTALIYFFIQIFGTGYKSFTLKFLKVQSIFSLLCLIALCINVLSGYRFNFGYGLIAVMGLGVLYLLEFSLLIITVVYYAVTGNRDAKIFSAGFACFIIFMGVDLLIFLTISTEHNFVFWQWGLFVFVFSLISILGRRVSSNYSQALKYSHELEVKNTELSSMWKELSISRDQLADMNKTLEKRVSERTEQLQQANEELVELNGELDNSNQDLISAMEQLKETQHQLIQSEKMAALGQLIANVAHEINTPLGAIRSSISLILGFFENEFLKLPAFFNSLPDESRNNFLTLLKASIHNNSESLSTKEERALRKTLTRYLQETDLPDLEECSDMLVTMGIYYVQPYMHILKDPNIGQILKNAYLLFLLKKNSSIIKIATERTSKVVFALKSYTHHDSSSSLLSADIREGIETVFTIYDSKIKHNIDLIKNYNEVYPIMCYPDELNQVWMNLIQNALYAMDYKGTLIVNVYQTDTHVIVSFTDSGCGIPDEIRDKIFMPFFTTKPQGEGSGLGLDIVKRIIDKHKGEIKVESCPGNTTFTVFIPRSLQ